MTISNNVHWQVLYVWPYLEWGGAQIYFAGLMKTARENYEVRALMPVGSNSKLLGYLDRLGVPYEFFPLHLDTSPASSIGAKLRVRLKNALCGLTIARTLTHRSLKQTILQLDIAPWSSFGLLAYLSWRTHTFVTLHIAIPKLSWIRKLEWTTKLRILSLLPGFHLLASNQDVRASLRSYLPERFLASVPLAYTGVDLNEIRQALEMNLDRSALCKRYGLPLDRLLALSVGQLIPRKGCRVLLEAAKRACEIDTRLFFVWIGDGCQLKEIETIITQEGVQNSFRIIRPAEIGPDRLDLLELIRMADLFVHPSFSEGLPGAVLEALALGKATIASRVNAIPEVIRNYETGLLVPPGDSAALAEAILEVASDAGLRERLGQAGQSCVLSNFDERNAAQVTVDYYDRCRRSG